MSCFVVRCRAWSTACKEVNNIEVIDIAYEGRNEVRGGYKEYVRESDLGELLYSICTVDTCTLIEIFRDIHKDT